MKGKRIFYSEIAYLAGILLLAFGTALMEKADFGMSMIVAPAYLLHLKVSEFLPFFTFGMSEYVFQAILLILLSVILRKVKKSYFLSFVTAIIYGMILDLFLSLTGLLPADSNLYRGIFYLSGMVICSFGVAFLFYTYFPPEAYELFVKEMSQHLNISIAKTKTIYDCCSCILGVILSLCFFGTFVGVKWGTIFCALINGWMIGIISDWLANNFIFKDALKLKNIMN